MKSALKNPKVLAAAKKIVEKDATDMKSWHVVDSGAADNVSDIKKEFPNHKITRGKAQEMGLNIKQQTAPRSRTKAKQRWKLSA